MKITPFYIVAGLSPPLFTGTLLNTEAGGHAARAVAVAAAAVAAVHAEGAATAAPVHRAKPTVATVRARLRI